MKHSKSLLPAIAIVAFAAHTFVGSANAQSMAIDSLSGAVTILNELISWTDTCVSERNDLMSAANGGQRVMWTGKVNKVWVPNDPTSSAATYAGGENGDTKAHLAYAALL